MQLNHSRYPSLMFSPISQTDDLGRVEGHTDHLAQRSKLPRSVAAADQSQQLASEGKGTAADPDPVPLCCYVNGSSKIQVIRGWLPSGWHLERVVFPGQRLMFEAPQQARLEIYTGSPVGAMLADTIGCDCLQVHIR